MPTDQNPQSGRRQHFHRGRRGPDRRGGSDRRPQHSPHERGPSDQVDVEQIMRDIRAQISQRHGIELSNQQIQELAARRLEAVLDPRTVKPALLDQLRRSAGLPVEAPTTDPQPARTFDSDILYASQNGLLRFFRRLLNPLLKLLFDPAPLIQALNDQAREHKEALRREAERDRRQAEWNALHFTIVQRLVTEVSRGSIEAQNLTMRVESLAAKVDFNERRVRGLESTTPTPPTPPSQPSPRVAEGTAAQPAASTTSESPTPATSPEGSRRRRRRRRGRRGAGGPPSEAIAAAAGSTSAVSIEGTQGADEPLEDDLGESADSLEDENPITVEADGSDPSFAAEEPWRRESPIEPLSETPTSIDSGRPEAEPQLETQQAPASPEPPEPQQPSPAPDEPFTRRPGGSIEPGPTDR